MDVWIGQQLMGFDLNGVPVDTVIKNHISGGVYRRETSGWVRHRAQYDLMGQYHSEGSAFRPSPNAVYQVTEAPEVQSLDPVPFNNLNLTDLWMEWRRNRSPFGSERRSFYGYLRERTTEPDRVDDEVTECGDCNRPILQKDATERGDEHTVGPCCDPYYSPCSHCDEMYRYMNTLLGGGMVCESCCGDYYSYCDECDGYYDSEDGDHNHDRSACCESPAREFFVRNDGDPLLANDTRVTVSLPAGQISQEGFDAIATYLQRYAYDNLYDPVMYGEKPGYFEMRALSFNLTELGEQWQTKEGNFTKRLSRYAYKQWSLKVPPEVLSEVGNIARDHSTAVAHDIEVTRNLNLPREDFAHSGSCWWSEYAQSRCAFKTNGGFGLRTFKDDGSSDWTSGVVGRAWVLPLKKVEIEVRSTNRRTRTALRPTFETENPDAFVVFNGYGNLTGYAPARIMAHMTGWTYRKIGFQAEPMYINSGGYLIGPEEIAKDYTDGSLSIPDLEEHSDLYQQEHTTKESEMAHV